MSKADGLPEVSINDLTAAVLVVHSPSGTIQQANYEAEEVTGFELSKLKTKKFHELFLDEDAERVKNLIENPTFEEKAYEYALVLKKKSGKKVVLDMGFRPMGADDGAGCNFVFTLHDITEMKKSEDEKIAGAQEDILHIMGSMLQSLFIIDSQGYVKMANASALKIIGLSKEKILEQPLQSVLKDDVFDRTRLKILQSGESFSNIETEMIGAGGTTTPVMLSASSLDRGKARSDLYLVVGTDISEKKHTEKLLSEQTAAMAQSARLSELGEMASGIAHEINNPLTVINGRLSLMKFMFKNTEKFDFEKAQNTVEVVASMFKRIESIVKSLRSFSRDAKEDPFENHSFDEILRDTLVLCEKKIEGNQVQFEIVEGHGDHQISCRPSEISQVLVNLINNAVDAVEEREEKWLKVHTSVENQWLEISVTDSGPGIPKELREKILTPFFTTKPVGKGTGLGLSISKDIIGKHNGAFLLDTKSRNTKFVIRLPIAEKKQESPPATQAA